MHVIVAKLNRNVRSHMLAGSSVCRRPVSDDCLHLSLSLSLLKPISAVAPMRPLTSEYEVPLHGLQVISAGLKGSGVPRGLSTETHDTNNLRVTVHAGGHV